MTKMNDVMAEQIKAVETASGHSVYGGSSLPRIVDCPASVQAGLKAGLKPESVYAAKGTQLHNVMEVAMKAHEPREFILSIDRFDGMEFTIEDATLCLDAADYVQEIIDLHPDGSYTIEYESQGSLISYGLPEVFGTADVIIKSALRVDVIDYKFGYGVAVYAEENYQLVTYLGMACEFIDTPPDFVELHVHICQPPKHIYDDWRLDYQKMYKMILGDITDAIVESRKKDPRYGPSEKACRFCPANMRCQERYAWLRENANLIQRMSQDPSQVTNEQWSKFLSGWSALKSAASQVEKFAMSEIMGGKDFPHYKLVAGRSNRKYKDDKAGAKYLLEVLGQEAYAKKDRPLVTLAQAEKIYPDLKKDEKWLDLIYKPEGTAKLVKADAKGKALMFGTAAIMNDLAAADAADLEFK